jgi:4-amino-4-deoxy-L-arabinose transferase-like glycosyltransferase
VATLAVAVGLFLLALAPRATALSTFVTWDELFWTRASLRFYRELDGQDWRTTYIIGQPGVITMWLMSGALAVRGGLAGDTTRQAILDAGQLRYRDDDVATMHTLLEHWRGLAVATALFAAAAVVLTWWWLRRPWGAGPALAAGVGLALEPFFIAHSRVVALDAVLASLCLLAVVALARYAASGTWRWLAAGAALSGLSTVQKVPAATLVLFGLAVVAVAGWRRGGWRIAASAGLVWCVVAVLAAVVAWPALWVAPVTTLAKVAATLRTYQSEAYDAMFFAGTAGQPPGPWFYPTVFLWRMSPVALIGLALLAWRAVRRDAMVPWATVAVLGGFSLAYWVMLTVPATKFDRYLLPALLPLVALAGLGWWHGLAPLAGHLFWRPWLPAGVVLVLGLVQLATVDRPYYLAWYNPFAGGLATARQVLPLGWGEGMDQVTGYLNELPDPSAKTVAADGFVSLAPSAARLVRAAGDACRTADYVLVYVFDRQLGRPAARAYAAVQPVMTARVGGMPYAWLYPGGRPCGP